MATIPNAGLWADDSIQCISLPYVNIKMYGGSVFLGTLIQHNITRLINGISSTFGGKKIAFLTDLVIYIEQRICWSWALSAFGYVVTVRDCDLHSCFPFVPISWAMVPNVLNIFVEQWNNICCILKCQGKQYQSLLLYKGYKIFTCII